MNSGAVSHKVGVEFLEPPRDRLGQKIDLLSKHLFLFGPCSIPMSRAVSRVQKELGRFLQTPPDNIPRIAMREGVTDKVYFLIQGPIDTPYHEGEYVVELTLPSGYPMKAPEIRMMTPSGRFKTCTSICTTFTHYHPETWSPLYSFTTIIVSLLSFMCEESNGVGSMTATDQERREFARKSREFNTKNGYDALFASFYAGDQITHALAHV